MSITAVFLVSSMLALFASGEFSLLYEWSCKWCHSRQNTVMLCRLRLKCDGTRAETRFCISAKRTSPFKSAGASVQSTTGSRGLRISGSNAGYTMFRGSVKSTGYQLHSSVSSSLLLPCVNVCHHISAGVLTPGELEYEENITVWTGSYCS